MTVSTAMAMGFAVTVLMHAVCRQIDHVAMAHAALGDDVIGEFLHIGASPLENRDFETTLVIEVYMKRRLRKVMVIVEVSGKAPGQFAPRVVVDVDERRHAWRGSGDLDGGQLQSGAGLGRALLRSDYRSLAPP